MAESSDKSSRKQGVIGTFQSLNALGDSVMDYFKGVQAKLQNLPQTNFELGKDMVDRGQVNDAVFRFHLTLWLSPRHVEAMYYLGMCYIARGQAERGVEYLQKALELHPGHEQARFLLASQRPHLVTPLPHTMPHELAQQYFNAQSVQFDERQQSAGYAGPQLMQQALTQYYQGEAHSLIAIDLGCGTGLCGAAIRNQTREIIGVDLSPEMIDLVGSKRRNDEHSLYHQLIQDDMAQYLHHQSPPKANVILACDCLHFVGELTQVFTGVGKTLMTGGLFICTYEPWDQEQGYTLLQGKGWYVHSDNYIRTLAQKAGLQEVAIEEVALYPDATVKRAVFTKAA